MAGPSSVTVRLHEPELAGLQALGARWGVNNSDALRGLVRLASSGVDSRLLGYHHGLSIGVTDAHRAVQSVIDEFAKLTHLLQAQIAAADAAHFVVPAHILYAETYMAQAA